VAAPFRYEAAPVAGVFLVSGFVAGTDDRAVAIEDEAGLADAIAAAVLAVDRRLAGDEFRFLRVRLDLSLAELSALFGIAEEKLGRWERDEAAIAGSADRLLRALYVERTQGRAAVQHIAKSLARGYDAPRRPYWFQRGDGVWRAVPADD